MELNTVCLCSSPHSPAVQTHRPRHQKHPGPPRECTPIVSHTSTRHRSLSKGTQWNQKNQLVDLFCLAMDSRGVFKSNTVSEKDRALSVCGSSHRPCRGLTAWIQVIGIPSLQLSRLSPFGLFLLSSLPPLRVAGEHVLT